MKKISLSIIFVLVTGCMSTQPKLQDEVNRLFSLDKQHFIKTMIIKDDKFEPNVTFTTQNGFKQNYGVLDVFKNDAFLRGFINKKSGKKLFQVYVYLNHRSGSWLFPYQANYGRPLRTSDATKVSSNVNCSKYSCRYEEHIVFEVEEKELRRMETLTPQDIATKTWQFKLKTKSGKDVMDGFNVNEILALLDVMDGYKPIKTL